MAPSVRPSIRPNKRFPFKTVRNGGGFEVQVRTATPEGMRVIAYFRGATREEALERFHSADLEAQRTKMLAKWDREKPAVSLEAVKRQSRRDWFRWRRKYDPVWRLNANMRAAIYQSLRGLKNRRQWQGLVDYSLDDLRAHLEAQFAAGMSWDHYGKWHIDHIRPLASFNITGPDCPEFKAAWALSNLQPLWGPDNLRKSAKWER